MTPRTLTAALLLAIPLVQPMAPAAVAQSAGLSLAQVERKYPRMSTVHIEKCDRDRDGVYTRSEMLCVQGIYQAMYLER